LILVFLWNWQLKRLVVRKTASLRESEYDLKLSEEQLRKSEKALRYTVEDLKDSQRIAHVGSWYLDVASNEVVWSEELYKMYNFDPSLPPPPYTEHQKLFTPESWSLLSAALDHTRETGIPYDLELENVRKDGSNGWMWVHGETVCDPDGVTVGLKGAAQDITERKKAEKALAESEERYRGLLDNMVGGVVIHASDTSVQYCNLQACSILGLSKRQMQGKEAIDPQWQFLRLNNESLPFEEYPVNQVLNSRQVLQNLIIGVKRPQMGDVVWVMVNGFPVFDVDGCINEVVVTFIDVTEHRKLENQLRQTEKMTAIGQLAGGIAHDFNNQLSGVLGYADMLVNRLEDEKLSKYAGNIKRGAKRAAELTAQLLAFSRKGKNLSVPVNIHKIVSEVTDILEHSIDKRIRMVQILNATPATTTGDPNQLQNAILNIALNARDAMPGGGEIIFKTEVISLDEELCREHHSELAPGDYLSLEISDSGCGIDAEAQKHIFEPFYTSKEVGEGTGMGLASVYGTVRNHKGSISVQSELGAGATFCICLPLAEDIRRESGVNIRNTPIRGTANILLVDDEEVVRNIAADMLEDLGYRVTVCCNGREAVERYGKIWQEIDLVLLDMIMPELGGRDTFAEMKKINPDVRAVLSSGYSINGEAQSILDDGVMDFVGKPFGYIELSEKIAKVLQSKR
jgi:PAS domain S-box-containing protein